MASNRRSIAVILRAEVANYKRDMAEAAKATRQVAEEATKTGYQAQSAFGKLEQYVKTNRDHINQLATGFALAGTSLLAFAGLAVAKFAEFDAAMSSVEAATGESAANMELLRQAALDAGSSTVFSATESAAAIEELAKAGVSTADILNGGLHGALNLAASDGIAVAEAAEIAASTLNQFGLEGRDASHVADLLAAGAASAQGGVSDLGQGLSQAGLVASQFGLSVEESVATLSAFASAGLMGSDAGTSFRAMLLRLANPTEEVKDLMAELGLEAYDAQGNFVGMAQFAGNLQGALEGMTQAQRDQTLAMIFGQDAIRSANILLSEGTEGIEQWIETVDQQGFAADQAATRLDNLKGDLEALSGAVETALIGMGEGGDGVLRPMVQHVTDLVAAFSDLPDGVQQATTLIAGGAGLVALGTGGLLKLTTMVSDAKTAFQTLGVTARTAGIAIGIATAGLALLAGALTFWSTKTAEARSRADAYAESVREVGDAARTSAAEIAANAFITGEGADWGWLQTARTGYDNVAEALQSVGSSAADAGIAVAGSQEEFDAYIDTLNDARTGNILQGLVIDELVTKMHQQHNALGDARTEQEQLAEVSDTLGTEQEQLSAASQATADALTAETEAVQGLKDAYAEADGAFIDILGGYQGVIDKNRELAEETAAATESSQDSWEDFYDGVSVSVDEYLTALEEQVAAQQSWEANMLLLSGRVSEGVIEHLASLGPEGAPLVADLVNASDEELSRLEDVFGQRGDEATDAFADSLTTAGPVLAEIARVAGEDAAAAAADALASGETTLQDVIDEYDLDFVVDADTGAALSSLNAFVMNNNGRRVTVWVDAKTGSQTGFRMANGVLAGYAGGGEVVGPGTETSDSILARLSRNEHVWSAAEVKGAGGHAAVARLRAEALTGAPPAVARFAQGGSPGWSARSMMPVASSAASGPARIYAPVLHNHRRPLTSTDLVRGMRMAEMLDPDR